MLSKTCKRSLKSPYRMRREKEEEEEKEKEKEEKENNRRDVVECVHV